VIPAKDRLKELEKTIDSVVSQTYCNFEVLVIENNSSDVESMRELINGFSDERIKFFSLTPCRNANVARNYGAMLSKGKYIAFLDSDDIWDKEHLQKNIDKAINSSSDFLYSGARINTGSKVKLRKSRNLKDNENPVDFLIGFKRSFAQTSSYFIDKQAFSIVKWDEDFNRNQDLDFLLELVMLLNASFWDV
jgi:glycosyltransferase involved in cell wall biosynthesis